MNITFSERTRQLARIAFWVALAFALTMAFLPKPPHLPVDRFGDKFEHMLAFVTMSVLAVVGFPETSAWRIVWRLSLVGGLIELVQSIPALHRDADVFDWLADTLAVLAVIAVVQLAGRLARAESRG